MEITYKINKNNNSYQEVEEKKKQWEDQGWNLKRFNTTFKRKKEEKEQSLTENSNLKTESRNKSIITKNKKKDISEEPS